MWSFDYSQKIDFFHHEYWKYLEQSNIVKNNNKNHVYRRTHFITPTFMIDSINCWNLDKSRSFFGPLFLHEYYDGNG